MASQQGFQPITNAMQKQDITAANFETSTLAIGSFDGVHLGHQALLRRMSDFAESAKLPAIALTFFPHPTAVLRGWSTPSYLMPPDARADQLLSLGADVVITQRFDHAFSQMTAGNFLDLVFEHLHPTQIWIGEDFKFGHEREGNLAFLEAAQPSYGFDLQVVQPILLDGDVVSSTRIRKALRCGDVELAARLLGRHYLVEGLIVPGAGRGHDVGFPTANLDSWAEQLLPASGVYACRAVIREQVWPAVVNIGVRPTFDHDHAMTLEAHLLDFTGDIYGEGMSLSFVKRLRGEQRFSSVDQLREQIQRDVIEVRENLIGEIVHDEGQ